MAIQTFQLGVVLAIGLSLASATLNAVATESTPIPLSLDIVDPPEDVVLVRGHSAMLPCVVRSPKKTGGFRVRWMLNGTVLPDNDGKWRILKNGTLIVPKMSGKKLSGNSLEGNYRCLVENADGALLSKPARVRFAFLGEFKSEPIDDIIFLSRPAIIPCSINSLPAAQIQWERDDLPLPQSTRYVPLPTGSLLINNIHSSDAGTYRCKAFNSVMNKTKLSNYGIVSMARADNLNYNPNVVIPPYILPIDIGFNVTVLVGDDVILYCIVDGRPMPTVHWLNDMKIVIGNSSLLVIKNVTVNATGTYTCSLSNEVGQTKQQYYVSVQKLPKFKDNPVSRVYPSGKTIRLDCMASGVPEPTIVWYKNGKPFTQNSIYGRAHQLHTGLIISYSIASDAGFYQCVAKNSAGSVWASALVKLNSSSNSPKAPTNVSCQSYNDTSVCLRWNSVPDAQAYSILAYHAGSRLKDYVTNETYKLANGLLPNTNYTFSIQTYSRAASNEYVQVQCDTGRIGERNLRVRKVGDYSVALSWLEVGSDRIVCGSDVPIVYKVQWRKVNQTSINMQEVSGLTKIIRGVQESVPYEYRVQSTNTMSEKDVWVEFELDPLENVTRLREFEPGDYNDSMSVPLVPDTVEAMPTTPYSINITWTDSNEVEITYVLCYTAVRDNRDCDQSRLVESVHKWTEVQNLKPNTQYEFRVRAYNAGTYSPYSYAVQVVTPSDVPTAVLDLKYRIVNSTAACVRWDPPMYENGRLTEYLIKYSPNNSWPLERWFERTLDVSNLGPGCWGTHSVSIVLTDLDEEKQYMLIVVALNDAGIGSPTIPITVSTKYHLLLDDLLPTNNASPKTANYNHRMILGILIGVVLSALILFLVINIKCFRRTYFKGRRLSRNNGAASSDASNQQQELRVPTTTDVNIIAGNEYEMQQLVSPVSETTHIPPLQPAVYLDTKGPAKYPNNRKQVANGRKLLFNNGVNAAQLRITENPQYFANKKVVGDDSTNNRLLHHEEYEEEDSNSNLQKFSLSKIRNATGNNDLHNSSLDSDMDLTQTTHLDDSRMLRLSPALGPNG